MQEMEREEAAEVGVGQAEETQSDSRMSGRTGTATRERQTADSMVPGDLWAVLTGQQPPPTSETTTGTEEAPASAEWRTQQPQPELAPERAPSYEKTPPLEIERPSEVQARPTPPLVLRPEFHAPVTVTSGPYRPGTAGSAVTTPAQAQAAANAAFSLRGERGRPGSAEASEYTALLRQGGRESLRKAVVLKEILGAPAAYRPPGWGWEEP